MERKSEVMLRVPIGELFQPLSMSEEDFVSEQGIYKKKEILPLSFIAFFAKPLTP